jgi:hypothetical protein
MSMPNIKQAQSQARKIVSISLPYIAVRSPDYDTDIIHKRSFLIPTETGFCDVLYRYCIALGRENLLCGTMLDLRLLSAGRHIRG